MKKIEKIYNHKVVELFFILLPIIEVITSYMINTMNTSLTIGVIYKSIFVIYGIFYLLFIDKSKKTLNYIILGIFCAFSITNFFVTINGFSLSNILSKATAVTKYITLPIALLFLHKYNVNGNKISLKTLVYSGLGYGLVMVISKITGTEIYTYNGRPNHGHSGWYNSGNEIGALVGMFYPFAIYYASKKRDILILVAVGVITYSLLALGTKTALVMLVITLISLFAFEFIMFFGIKEKIMKKTLLIISVLIVIVTITVPISPTFKFLAERIEVAKNQTGEIEEENNEEHKLVAENFMFSGRNRYMELQLNAYEKTNIFERLFGMNDGSKHVYDDGTYCTIERDFFDIFFTYGIVGLIIYYIPIVYIGLSFLKRVFTNFKNECNRKNFVMGISALLVLGTSYIAGHVLLSTTVSLFFSVILINLTYKEKNKLLEGCEE